MFIFFLSGMMITCLLLCDQLHVLVFDVDILDVLL